VPRRSYRISIEPGSTVRYSDECRPTKWRKCTRPEYSPAMMVRLSEATAQLTISVAPMKVAILFPLDKSQRRSVRSCEAVPAQRPSGVTATPSHMLKVKRTDLGDPQLRQWTNSSTSAASIIESRDTRKVTTPITAFTNAFYDENGNVVLWGESSPHGIRRSVDRGPGADAR
jgi:hypothetical protein